MASIGIDLGTTNSCVAWYNNAAKRVEMDWGQMYTRLHYQKNRKNLRYYVIVVLFNCFHKLILFSSLKILKCQQVSLDPLVPFFCTCF